MELTRGVLLHCSSFGDLEQRPNFVQPCKNEPKSPTAISVLWSLHGDLFSKNPLSAYSEKASLVSKMSICKGAKTGIERFQPLPTLLLFQIIVC